MNLATANILQSWSLEPAICAALAVLTWVYLRGWLVLQRRGAIIFDHGPLLYFLGGVATLFIALQSPLDVFAGFLMQVHMVQHLLLLLVAPILFWLSEPQLPLMAGLPAALRRNWVAPFASAPIVRSALRPLLHPVVTWTAFVLVLWLWHAPPLYEAALRSDFWHRFEHATLFAAGLLFWWPVIQPYPSRPRVSRWTMIPYLFLAGVQGTALASVLTFSDRVLYAHYRDAPRLGGWSALADQQVAGAIMWVPMSLALIVATVAIVGRVMGGSDGGVQRKRWRVRSPVHRPRNQSTPRGSAHSANDLLGIRIIGSFLRNRPARFAMRVGLFGLGGLVVLDGLAGPQIAPVNLAGILPWVHWRGLVVVGLLVIGNLFCMACPFMLFRKPAKRLLGGARRWPKSLRSKWPAVALLLAFFWAYEAFALWDSPWWTAWIVMGYLAAALTLNGLFHGAPFCKYVCPIGQFNFIQSLVSPTEIKSLDGDRCRRCATKECIRGSSDGPGCELNLYLPRKSTNMDCTLCMDCVDACPHDNIGLVAATPGGELLRDLPRSGIGRFSERRDLVALTLVLVFAAYLNAAWMVAPAAALEQRVVAAWGTGVGRVAVAAVTVIVLGLVPPVLIVLAGFISRRLAGIHGTSRGYASAFAYTLVPSGFAMWLAHFGFHLFTGFNGAGVAARRFVEDWAGLRVASSGVLPAMSRIAEWILPIQLLFLDVGLCMSLYLAYRLACLRAGEGRRGVAAFLPWAMLILLLFGLGVWITAQPMQMRGTMAMVADS